MAKRTQHTIGLDIGTSKVTCIAGEPGEGGLMEVVGIGEADARGLHLLSPPHVDDSRLHLKSARDGGQCTAPFATGSSPSR